MGRAQPLLLTVVHPDTCTCVASVCIDGIGYRNTHTHPPSAICGVIAQEGTDKNTCTRALWCLANQNFHVSQCSHMVAMVISTVGAAVRSQHYGTPTVDNEALNLLVR